MTSTTSLTCGQWCPSALPGTVLAEGKGGLQIGWDEPFTQHPTIPLNTLGHPSHSSLLVPFMLGVSKGCRAGVAGQHSEGQLPRTPVAAHRAKILLHLLHFIYQAGILHLHLSDLLTEPLAQSSDLGEGDGEVSPRAGSLSPGSLHPPWSAQSWGQFRAWPGQCLQHILSSMRRFRPQRRGWLGGSIQGWEEPLPQ